MPKEKTQSYRLWVRAIKAVRKVERATQSEKNISRTILFLTDFYEANKKSLGELAAEFHAKRGGF